MALLGEEVDSVGILGLVEEALVFTETQIHGEGDRVFPGPVSRARKLSPLNEDTVKANAAKGEYLEFAAKVASAADVGLLRRVHFCLSGSRALR